MDDHWKDRYALERTKREWLEDRIRNAVPEWTFERSHRFEYNTLYDFWRARYAKVRDLIKAYEMLAGKLDVGPGYEFIIDDDYLYVREPSTHVKNRYQSLINHTPLLAPYGPEVIYRMKKEDPDLDWLPGSYGTTIKSHAFRCYDKDRFVKLEHFYASNIGNQGYTTKLFTKGRGPGVEYVMVLTHSTETADACVELLLKDGYTTFGASADKRVKKPKVAQAQSDLESREQELMKALEAVRKQMSDQ